MIKIHAAFLATLCMCLYSGCGDNLPTQPGRDVIMPFKVGNVWMGRETIYDINGNVIDARLDTLKITSTVVISGEM